MKRVKGGEGENGGNGLGERDMDRVKGEGKS